ncbi:helix-turn-helix domain-containing protein [Neolewinella sp.]|uniref:helix-turn-helix domain-containing protein n=1 Tax=Neolewinella sp. TaxID=2993543 RepID=UPI003B51592D
MLLKTPILLHKQTKSAHQSFLNRFARVPHLYNNWHYHRELELLYVIRGDGTRFVGDSIEPFFSGDLVLVGSDVPHFWRSDARYFEGREEVYAELILTQFVPDLLGDAFELSEFRPIKKLIERAQHGIRFLAATRDQAGKILHRITATKGSKRIILLLQLLELLATTEEYYPLSTLGYRKLLTDASSQRLREVSDYMLKHYLRPLPLPEVAAVANMSEKAFCRFFKGATQKTFVQFLTELRVSHACKLLLSHNQPIGEVCFASGFNNLSNFNRLFKRTMGRTPRQYRRHGATADQPVRALS